MRSFRQTALILLLLAAAACTQVQTGRHIAATDYTGSPQRMFIIDRLDSSFDETLPRNFEAAIVPALATCDVAALVYRPNSLELNAEAKLAASLVAFRPDTILNMVQTNRNSINYEVRSGSYIVTLHDVAQRRDLWKARMGVGASTRLFADRSGVGAKFAKELVNQLQADNVVKTCPPPAPKSGT